jgi:ribonuclease D
VVKVFHHAMFDLRFMVSHWSARPANVACTKNASKLLDPQESDHTLKGILNRHLGVHIEKGQRLSDWTAGQLSSAQVAYAAGDVGHLIELLSRLRAKLDAAGLGDLLAGCFAHIPTRVQLDLRRYPDIYTY